MKKFIKASYIFIVLAFIYIPIFILIIASFNSERVMGVWGNFSLVWYAELAKVKDVIFNTLLLAIVSATIATIIGTLGAIGIYYSKGKAGKVVKGMSQIPVVNSEVVTACALVMLFIILGLSNRSIFGLYVGHIILCAPFVVLSVMPKLKQMDSSLYEAALDLGATPFQALFKVILPEILPGIFTGFMLSITLSLDDYIITAMLAPLGYDTISTAVYKALAHATEQSGKTIPIYRALTTIIFVITLIVVLAMNFVSKKKDADSKRKV